MARVAKDKLQPKPTTNTITSVNQVRDIKDKINHLRQLGLREYPFLTIEQAKVNPFDPKTDNYAYLARKTMLVLSKEEMETLNTLGVIVMDGKSRVYGDHSIMKLS